MTKHNRMILAAIVMFTSMSCSKMLEDVNTEKDTNADTGTTTATHGGASTDSTSGSSTTAQGSDSATNTGTVTETPSDTGTQSDSNTTDTGAPSDSDTADTGSLPDSNTTDTGSLPDSNTTDTGSLPDSNTTDTGSLPDSDTTDTGSLPDSATATSSGTDTTTATNTDSASDTVYICSEENCNGSCYACNGHNECVPVPAGVADPAGVCADQSSNACGTNGMCDGDGGCQLKLAPNAECNRTCSAGVETVYTCDPDTHICDNVQTTIDCGAPGCVPTGDICMEPCTEDADCDTGSQFCCTATLATTPWCSVAGNCVSKLSSGSSVPAGAAEADAYRCESGVIADGICCNDAEGCDGVCEYCGQPDGNCYNYNDDSGVSSGDVCAHCMYCGGDSADCVVQPAGMDLFDDCSEDMANECGLSGDCNGNATTPDCAYKLNVNDPCGTPGCTSDGATATMSASFCDIGHACSALDTDCNTGYGCNGDECTVAGECAIDIGADAGCTTDNAFCCTDTDDDVTGCSVGDCAARIAQGGAPACSHDGHCVAGVVCSVDNVCCNSNCDGECQACDGSFATTRGTCAGGATMDGWEDPDYCIAAGETSVDQDCRGTCSGGICSFPGNELQCGDACDACGGAGYCDDVPAGVDLRCNDTDCSAITMHQQLGDDGPSYVTPCQSAAAIPSQTSNCNLAQECLTQSEWCVAPDAASPDWTTIATAHLCEGWGTHCVGTTGPSGSPDYFISNEVCSTTPSAHCEPPHGAGVGPSCVASPPPRLIWPENGINLWAHTGNNRQLLNGQRFVFDSPFATSIPELSGQTVTVDFTVEFSYFRDDFSDTAFRLDNCLFGSDADFVDKIICTFENEFPLEPDEGSGYIFWRAVQSYNYGVTGLDVVQYSNVWQFKPTAPNDVDGDGYSDVVIGRLTGNPVIFAGGTSALSGEYGSSESTWEMAVSFSQEFSSSWVASVGDINGDRISDFAIGDTGTNLIYIVPGSSEFSDGTNYLTDMIVENRAYTLTPPSLTNPESAIAAVIGMDIDGNGYDDIVLGEYQTGTSDFTGRIHVFYGPIEQNLTSADVDITIDGPTSTSRFGYNLANGGDIDGDGYLDLLVGSYYINQAHVIRGGTTFPTSDTDVNSAEYFSITGWSLSNTGQMLSSARDVNLDGYADILVGSPAYDTPSTNAGAMTIIYSDAPSSAADINLNDDSSWDVQRIAAVAPNTCPNCRLGGSFTSGHFDDNATVDLLLGARGDGSTNLPTNWLNGNVFIERSVVTQAASAPITETAYIHVQGDTEGQILGRWTANVGDVDNDGLDDMAWSDVYFAESSGAVYVLKGAEMEAFTGTTSATITGTGTEGLGQSICTYFTHSARGAF